MTNFAFISFLHIFLPICTGIGVDPGKDGGWICITCKKLHVAKGNSNPVANINNCYYGMRRVEEKSQKQELTSIYIQGA